MSDLVPRRRRPAPWRRPLGQSDCGLQYQWNCLAAGFGFLRGRLAAAAVCIVPRSKQRWAHRSPRFGTFCQPLESCGSRWSTL